MSRLLNFFLQGLLITVPIFVTVYVLYSIFSLVDGWVPSLFPSLSGIPGLGILMVLTIVTLAGFLGTKYITNPLGVYFERLVERTPLVKLIYSSVKDLISAFVGEKKSFNKPVLVTYSENPQIQKIGFITQDDLQDLGIPAGKIAVYLPYSYGMNGQLVVISKEYVHPIDATGPEMMKFVISGGVSEI
jgi:uncharacterized membrane protein